MLNPTRNERMDEKIRANPKPDKKVDETVDQPNQTDPKKPNDSAER